MSFFLSHLIFILKILDALPKYFISNFMFKLSFVFVFSTKFLDITEGWLDLYSNSSCKHMNQSCFSKKNFPFHKTIIFNFIAQETVSNHIQIIIKDTLYSYLWFNKTLRLIYRYVQPPHAPSTPNPPFITFCLFSFSKWLYSPKYLLQRFYKANRMLRL